MQRADAALTSTANDPDLGRAGVRPLVAAPVGRAPGPLRDARPAALGAAVPGRHRLGVLVPAKRGVRSRAGSGAARYRGRAAAGAPAPDREPRAADPDRARAGQPHPRSRHLPRPGGGLHRRPSRDQQPDLAQRQAHARSPAIRGRRSLPRPASAASTRRRRCRSSIPALRPRRRSSAAATARQTAYSRPFADSFGNPVFQAQIPLIDHGVFHGALVAEYSVERLLRYFVPTEIARRHAITVLDERSRSLASTVMTRAAARRRRGRRSSSSCRSRRPRTAWSCAARATGPRSA